MRGTLLFPAPARWHSSDAFGFPWCVFGRAPDTELVENEFPLLVPLSNHWKDSCGHGKHRGGVGTAQIWVAHHVPAVYMMAIAPIANLTRFYKAVPIMVGPVDVGRSPISILPCFPAEGPAGGRESRTHALALGANSLDWRLTDPGAAAVLTTDGEFPVETDIGALRMACHTVRGAIEQAAGRAATRG